MPDKQHIMILAGETSGDAHAAEMVERQDPGMYRITDEGRQAIAFFQPLAAGKSY